VYRKLLR